MSIGITNGILNYDGGNHLSLICDKVIDKIKEKYNPTK